MHTFKTRKNIHEYLFLRGINNRGIGRENNYFDRRNQVIIIKK